MHHLFIRDITWGIKLMNVLESEKATPIAENA